MGLIIAIIVLDQLFKASVIKLTEPITVIDGLLNINYVQNTGAAFGVFQNSNLIIMMVSAIICVLVFMYMLKSFKSKKSEYIPLCMILAGGISNIIDRVFRGFVVDYIDTPFIATFNLADSFIVIGVIIMIIVEIKEIFKSENSSR